jgi:hypothetical protein
MFEGDFEFGAQRGRSTTSGTFSTKISSGR